MDTVIFGNGFHLTHLKIITVSNHNS